MYKLYDQYDAWGKEQVLGCVAHGWKEPETSHQEYDHQLAINISRQVRHEINGWYDSAAMFHNNERYYRRLLEEIAGIVGVEAFTANDGTVYDNALCIKLPEIIRRLLSKPVHNPLQQQPKVSEEHIRQQQCGEPPGF